MSAANGIICRRRHVVWQVGKRLTTFAAAVLCAEFSGTYCAVRAVFVLAAFATAVLAAKPPTYCAVFTVFMLAASATAVLAA